MNITLKTNHELLLEITKIAKDFNSTDESYLLAYPYFLNYFKNINEINIENLIIGISFTYSWMPTILKSLKLNLSDQIISILNDAKNGKIISENQLKILKTTFNNSLVGTSKLLHFINPNQYAIWDSRVFYFLTQQTAYTHRIENPRLYLDYLQLIQRLTEEQDFQVFYDVMQHQVGYQLSKYRAVELAFFIGGK